MLTYKWMKRQLIIIIIQLICDNWIFEKLMELGNLKRPLVFVMYKLHTRSMDSLFVAQIILYLLKKLNYAQEFRSTLFVVLVHKYKVEPN